MTPHPTRLEAAVVLTNGTRKEASMHRGPSARLRAFVNAVPDAVRGLPSACFDTRYRGPILLMGSAAGAASKALSRNGAEMMAPPESFFISAARPQDEANRRPRAH